MTSSVSSTSTSAADLYESINEANGVDDTDEDTSSDSTSEMFMNLLIAQLQNQDPTSPTDTSTFVNQLATMTEVENSISMTDSINDLADALTSSQSALQASSMVGQNIYVESDSAELGDDGTISGAYDLDASADDVEVVVYDSDGNLVDTVSLGSQSSGTHDFTWDGSDQEAGEYQIVVQASTSGSDDYDEVTTYLAQNVNSVTLSTSGGDFTMNTSSGSYTMDDVLQIG